MKHKIIILDSTYPTFKELTEKLELSKELMFLEITKDLLIKTDIEKYPESIFYFNSDDKLIFEQDNKNKFIWINYDLLWSIFENEYRMEYMETQRFTVDMLGKHFKLKGLKPMYPTIIKIEPLEKHFKLKGLTPRN